jgi:hypothetical protein
VAAANAFPLGRTGASADELDVVALRGHGLKLAGEPALLNQSRAGSTTPAALAHLATPPPDPMPLILSVSGPLRLGINCDIPGIIPARKAVPDYCTQ